MMAEMAGVPVLTLNRLAPVATSLPVVTVTFDAPVDAPTAMVSVAVRWVASVTLIAEAVMPLLLKETVEVPDAKWVN